MAFTFSPVGDSHLTAQYVDLPAAIAAGKTWAITAAAGPEVSIKNGYGHTGYNTYELSRQVADWEPDICALMSGTNDRSDNMARYKTRHYLLSIFDEVHAKKNLIMAIPPQQGEEAECAAHNAWLESLAYTLGAEFFDPWVMFRNGLDGAWLPGFSIDGRHLAVEFMPLLGTQIRGKLFDMMGLPLPS